MKMLVDSKPERNFPSSSKQDSKTLREVVPTAMILLPSLLALFKSSACSGVKVKVSSCISCWRISFTFTGLKVPKPTFSPDIHPR